MDENNQPSSADAGDHNGGSGSSSSDASAGVQDTCSSEDSPVRITTDEQISLHALLELQATLPTEASSSSEEDSHPSEASNSGEEDGQPSEDSNYGEEDGLSSEASGEEDDCQSDVSGGSTATTDSEVVARVAAADAYHMSLVGRELVIGGRTVTVDHDMAFGRSSGLPNSGDQLQEGGGPNQAQVEEEENQEDQMEVDEEEDQMEEDQEEEENEEDQMEEDEEDDQSENENGDDDPADDDDAGAGGLANGFGGHGHGAGGQANGAGGQLPGGGGAQDGEGGQIGGDLPNGVPNGRHRTLHSNEKCQALVLCITENRLAPEHPVEGIVCSTIPALQRINNIEADDTSSAGSQMTASSLCDYIKKLLLDQSPVLEMESRAVKARSV